MIVCLCAGTNSQKINRVIDEGATSVAAIGKACGAGTHCGGCRDMLAHLVAQRVASAEVAADPARQPA